MHQAAKLSHKTRLAHYPFELHGKKVNWDHCCAYVKRILMDKIQKGHIAIHYRPSEYIDVNQIFIEKPKTSKGPIENPNPECFNPYALCLEDPVIRKLLTEV